MISLLSKGLSRDFCSTTVRKLRASQVAVVVKDLTANTGNVRELGLTLGQEDPLEKEMATVSRIIAWRTPWTEEPGGLQSTGLQRARYN